MYICSLNSQDPLWLPLTYSKSKVGFPCHLENHSAYLRLSEKLAHTEVPTRILIGAEACSLSLHELISDRLGHARSSSSSCRASTANVFSRKREYRQTFAVAQLSYRPIMELARMSRSHLVARRGSCERQLFLWNHFHFLTS